MKKIFVLLFTLFLAGPVYTAVAQCQGSCCDGDIRKEETKSIIYMIGDGMGLAQVNALMLERGYAPVNMDRAHAVGLVKTYSANNRVTDSAAAGTALATGTKTNNSTVGIDPEGNILQSVMAKAVEAGLGSGIVVTCSITDATPAAFFAHVEHRRDYETVARQFTLSGIDVLMGGGRAYFDQRSDGVNLLDKLRAENYFIAEDLDDLTGVERGKVVCLISEKDPAPALEGRGDYLPDAVAKSLEILSRNASGSGKGFFLMVEGSQIDWACHRHQTEYMLGEMEDFDKAIGVALDFADNNPGTLVVVLADHETGV